MRPESERSAGQGRARWAIRAAVAGRQIKPGPDRRRVVVGTPDSRSKPAAGRVATARNRIAGPNRIVHSDYRAGPCWRPARAAPARRVHGRRTAVGTTLSPVLAGDCERERVFGLRQTTDEMRRYARRADTLAVSSPLSVAHTDSLRGELRSKPRRAELLARGRQTFAVSCPPKPEYVRWAERRSTGRRPGTRGLVSRETSYF